ncbi:hypothetical protein D3C71_1895140 [compost metagenome]
MRLPVLAWGNSRQLLEHGSEIAAVVKANLLSNVRHPHLGPAEQRLGLLHPQLADIVAEGDTCLPLEQIAQIVGRHMNMGSNSLQRAAFPVMGLNVLFGLDHHIVPLLR